jgi:hypothetical protein
MASGAITRLLDDAPISEAKRRKLKSRIDSALELDPDTVPLVITSFLATINIVDLPFIDVWNLIQVFPVFAPILWTDQQFRARMDLEFNDVFRDSLDPDSGEMRDALVQELREMSTKSSSRFYPRAPDSLLPWALLYQRCKRMMVLIKNLNGKAKPLFSEALSQPLPDWFSTLAPDLYFPISPYEELDFENSSANGAYIATPITVGGEILSKIIVTNWTNTQFTEPRILDVRNMEMRLSVIPQSRSYSFAITHTGSLVYLLSAGPGYQPYLEVYDPHTEVRIPGSALNKIAKAQEFCNGVLRFAEYDFWAIKPVQSSSMMNIVLSGDFTRFVDIDSYVDYLQDTRQDVKYALTEENLYLQNGWESSVHLSQNPAQFYRVLTKDGNAAPGAEPLYVKKIQYALGPFFSVSRKQPLEIHIFKDRQSQWIAPGTTTAVLAQWSSNDNIQSSMFVIARAITSLQVHHGAGFGMFLNFESFDYSVYPISIVGAKVLIRYKKGGGKLRHAILDLEVFFIERLHGFSKLIRSPCRTCSLPSLASCCRTTYCGKECQTEDWSRHAIECKNKV